jgi:hypothetical protein
VPLLGIEPRSSSLQSEPILTELPQPLILFSVGNITNAAEDCIFIELKAEPVHLCAPEAGHEYRVLTTEQTQEMGWRMLCNEKRCLVFALY